MTATLTIPTEAAELEELLSDPKKARDVFSNKNTAKDFITKYVNAFGIRDKGVTKKELDEQIQLGVANFLRDSGFDGKPPADLRPDNSKLRGVSAKDRRGGLYNDRAPGARLEGVYADARELLQTASWREPTNRAERDARATRIAKVTEVMNSFGSEVPADGGFLIPETLRSQILSVALESAVVRPLATVIPMESLRVPIPTIDDTSHASSVYGGIVGYWTEEGAALTESQATFGRVVLEAKKLTGYAEIPNELLADASAFGGFFEARFPQAIAYFEDVAFTTGTGTGEPLGYINAPAAVTVSAVAGQGANTIIWENVVGMYARMLPTSLKNAVWIVSPDTFPQLATMALSVGTGGSAVWLGNLQQPGAASPPMSILGRPVYVSEKANALGTAGDINFVDLSYYLIGDRQQVMVESSPHFKFSSDKTAFRIIERVDGRPWIQSAITPHNGGNSLSPFVQLSSTRT